jgi:hypothetical protein
MKLAVRSVLLGICLTFVAFAQSVAAEATKITKEELPAPVLASFEKEFAGATVENYYKTSGSAVELLYEVRCKKGEVPYEVLYYPDGKLYKSVEVLKDATELPQAAQDFLQQNHAETKFKRYLKVNRPSSGIEYMASGKDLKLTFDAQGNVKGKN